MTSNAVIIGSGKTARDIGLFFHQRGFDVTWLVGPDFENEMTTFIQKRLQTNTDQKKGNAALRIQRRDVSLTSIPDVVLESRAEDLGTKREAFDAVRDAVGENTLLLTNSSSILPGEISPNTAGMHFFYPAALTGFVELIFQEGFSPTKQARIEALARSLSLQYICQDTQSAFFVNRLLLPLQAETVRLFLSGVSRSALNDAASSSFLPIGQFQIADEIGIDVLRAGVANYVGRMTKDAAFSYATLLSALAAWQKAGILGKKNKRRLMRLSESEIRSALDPIRPRLGSRPQDLRTHFLNLFLCTCRSFIDESICTPDALDAALSAVYGAERSFLEVWTEVGENTIRDDMARHFGDTGLSYFAPSRFSSNR